MDYDAHIHMALDGVDWRAAIAAHLDGPAEALLHARLAAYRQAGITWLRDGGDRWGVSLRAAQLAPAYGIRYRTPAFPLYPLGRYGGFIGRGYRDLAQYRELVAQVRRDGGHFIKLMLSGIMDFHRYGVLSDPPMDSRLIRDLIAIAHDAGFAVMAHCNGAAGICAAVAAGVDSLEHGGYMDTDAADALAESRTVWVPTLSALGNLIGTGRGEDAVLHRILADQQEMVRRVVARGGHVACGSDAGAYALPHPQGSRTEYVHLVRILGRQTDAHLAASLQLLKEKF